ncbi:MAG: DUF5693 family protein [Armatimonadota bacterium]|nr:DUF5693 family protein [bacterium]
MSIGRRIFILAALIIGLAASFYVAGQRARVESRNKAVQMVLDYGEMQGIAASTGNSVVDVMRKFKDAGATSVAIDEETVGSAIDDRLIIPVSDRKFAIPGNGAVQLTAELLKAVPNLRGKITAIPLPAKPKGSPDSQFSYIMLRDSIPTAYINQLPIGLPADAVKAARNAGLEPVARLLNYTGASLRSIGAIFHDVKTLGVEKIIFQGDQVLGFKGAVKASGRLLAKNDLDFGRVEFSKQKGEFTLAQKTPANQIIVHSITQAEMPTLDEPSIVDRFQKAVRERGVRIIYVRMYDTASSNVLVDNFDYVRAIGRAVEKAGYTLTSAHPSEEIAISRGVRAIVGAGVAAGALLLILALVDLSTIGMVLWSLALLIGCVGLAWLGVTGQKAVALLSAMVFPTFAAVNATRNTPDLPKPTPLPVMRTLGRFVVAVATVAAGGMLIVGLLSQRTFMLRIDQFAGVKMAHLMPVLVLAVLYGARTAWSSAAWDVQKARFTKRIREISSNPILLWQALGMVFVLAVVAVMVARSGNDSGVGVSPLELKFRSILDKVLYVRPRTKEFLIGYPALILGIASALRGRRTWAAPLMVIGSIGLVSALNTFCHIHTPLALSVLRVVNGAVVGGLLGTVLLLIARRRG